MKNIETNLQNQQVLKIKNVCHYLIQLFVLFFIFFFVIH